MRYDQSGGTCQDGSPENFAWGYDRRVHRSQRDQMATEGMIFAVEIDAVEGFLHRVFLKGGAEVTRDGGGAFRWISSPRETRE